MKTTQELCREIHENENLRAAFDAAEKNHTIAEFLKEQGVEEDEMLFLKTLRESAPDTVALSDDRMTKAVGGQDLEGFDSNPSNTALYKIGDRVRCVWYFSPAYFEVRVGVVLGYRYDTPTGYNERPSYAVRFDDAPERHYMVSEKDLERC